MALNYRYDKKGKVTGIGWGKGKNYESGQKAQTKNTKTTTPKKKKKPLTRAAKLKADKAKRKAEFDAHQKAIKKKGQGKMTLKERQAADWKEAQGAAAKKHDEFQKKHKRGKYSTKGKEKERAKQYSEGKDPNRGTNKKNLLVGFQRNLPWFKNRNKKK